MDVFKKIIRRLTMAVLTKKEILEQVKTIVGENTDDTTLKFLEDISDTMDDLETKANGDGEDWKSKYETLDKEWRTKYQERFFNGSPEDDKDEPENDLTKPQDLPEDEEDEAPKHFEDLFTEG